MRGDWAQHDPASVMLIWILALATRAWTGEELEVVVTVLLVDEMPG